MCALALDDLDAALSIIAQSVPETEAESKWKALGNCAPAVRRFDLAKEVYEKAGDLHLGSLMLLVVCMGDKTGLERVSAAVGVFQFCLATATLTALGGRAGKSGTNNQVFAASLELGDTCVCVDLLIKTGWAPEAALFARTYVPR